MTVDEAAIELRSDRMTVYRAVHAGQIPHIRVGRKILVPTWFFRQLRDGTLPKPDKAA